MAKKIVIQGGSRLYGDVMISGMKNAALPILFATIPVRGEVVLENIPPVSDITTSLEILSEMGAEVRMLTRTSVRIDTTYIKQGTAPFSLTSRLR